ncbi:MAG: Fic family protein [Bacteroidota bacterium]
MTSREQIKLSYSAHFHLVSIHPHYDGNGRTSRLLMNKIQKRYNLPLAIVHEEERQDYFVALEETRKKDLSKHLRSSWMNNTSNTSKEKLTGIKNKIEMVVRLLFFRGYKLNFLSLFE